MPVGVAFRVGGTLVTGGTLFTIIVEQSGEASTPDWLWLWRRLRMESVSKGGCWAVRLVGLRGCEVARL